MPHWVTWCIMCNSSILSLIDWLINWLIDWLYIVFYLVWEYYTHTVWETHHCCWTAAEFRSMLSMLIYGIKQLGPETGLVPVLSAYGLWAVRDLYSAIHVPATTRDLWFRHCHSKNFMAWWRFLCAQSYLKKY